MSAHGATTPEDIAIEQARARGLTVEQTAADLDADLDHVWFVWAAMDALAAVTDAPRPDGPRRKSDAEHGTYARFQIHRGQGEEPCDPCRDARTRYEQQRPTRSHTRAAS